MFKPGGKAAAPFAFFSYGMTKCGSTLAFQLTRTALIEAGYDQPTIPFSAEPPRNINFISKLQKPHAPELRAALRAAKGPLVIKTHGRPTPRMVYWIEGGEGRGHAVFRDPRDMALSMVDHGRRSRAQGRPAFSEIHTLEDACNGIEHQLNSLSAWLQLPGIKPMQYERFAFDTEAGAAQILEDLGLEGNPRRIARKVARADKTQRNKAVPERHKSELTDAQNRAITARFAPFYDILFNKPDVALPLPPNTDFNAGLDNPLPLS